MIIKELINWGHQELIEFDSARLDAELLLMDLLKCERTYVLAHDDEEVGFFKEWRFKWMIGKRKKGIPMAYLRGHKEFYGLDFKTNKHVLVPRPGTESLVEAVIDTVQPGDLLVDVGTGSACIPISVLKNAEKVSAVATDISSAALKVAKENARHHNMEFAIQFFQSDLLNNVSPEVFEGKELVVTANLPYVPKDYTVNIETKFEPQIALYGGDDGLDLFRRLLDQLLPLKPKAMFFECFGFQMALLDDYAEGYEWKQSNGIPNGAGVMVLVKGSGKK